MHNLKTLTSPVQIRAYFEAVDWQLPLPKEKDILENPLKFQKLLIHLSANHESLNSFHYSEVLNEETYSIFLFSILYYGKNFGPNYYAWQVDKNAEKLLVFAKNHNHPVAEIFILKLFTKFSKCHLTRKNRIFMIEKFEKQYFGL